MNSTTTIPEQEAPNSAILTTAIVTDEIVEEFPIVTEKEAGLALIPRKTIEEYFTKGGMDDVIEAIEAKVAEFAPNMTTPKGRKEIKSFAAKVTKSKTYIEGIGKDFVAEAKAEIKKVDAVRKDTRERLEALAVKARAPLTAWEGKEKARVEELTTKVEEIVLHGTLTDEATGQPKPLSTLRVSLKYLENMVIDESWSEFQDDASTKMTMAKIRLQGQITQLEELEALQAEKDEAERVRLAEEKKKHEQEIADNAARKAKEEAQQEARRLQEAADNKAQEEKLRAEKAEQRAKDAERRAENAAQEAEKRAADKIAAEQKAKEVAEAKRKADVEHRGKVNREILAALGKASPISENVGKQIITAMVKGEIPHVKVVY